MTAAMTAADAAYEIERLLQFGLQKGLLEPLDIIAARNALLDLFGLPAPYTGDVPEEPMDSAESTMNRLLDYAAQTGLLPDQTVTMRDLLDARIMGLLMPRPSEVVRQFQRTVEEQSIEAATAAFYDLCIASNYIRMDRVRNNRYWLAHSAYGELEITINLSKPEKDPQEIAKLKQMQPAEVSYPSCQLCVDNMGYAGRLDHPARQNHRVLPLTLAGERWYFQYSPYVYYNEHCILFHSEHVPMRTTAVTFQRLLEAVEQFPHYFVGSNADLPIVGGSILNHDHFQGGRHIFPMERADAEAEFVHPDYPSVRVAIVRWPMSVLRLSSKSKAELLALAVKVLEEWREYSDPVCEIAAYTEAAAVAEQAGTADGERTTHHADAAYADRTPHHADAAHADRSAHHADTADGDRTPHNTITPIARFNRRGEYELDLVLRNNRMSAEHPDGIFHPHQELHHIKRENIGLIEVMGLAVLPGRLKAELDAIEQILAGRRPCDRAIWTDADHPLHKHAPWIEQLIDQYGTELSADAATQAVQAEVGIKFLQVLLDAGVYKRDDNGRAGFHRFAAHLGFVMQPAGGSV